MASARVKPAKVPSDNESGYSGRLLLRMDPALHAGLAQAAERDGHSLNAYITGVLSDDLGGPPRPTEDPGARAAGRLIRAAIIADLVLVAVAAAIAIALLVIAWP